MKWCIEGLPFPYLFLTLKVRFLGGEEKVSTKPTRKNWRKSFLTNGWGGGLLKVKKKKLLNIVETPSMVFHGFLYFALYTPSLWEWKRS